MKLLVFPRVACAAAVICLLSMTAVSKARPLSDFVQGEVTRVSGQYAVRWLNNNDVRVQITYTFVVLSKPPRTVHSTVNVNAASAKVIDYASLEAEEIDQMHITVISVVAKK